MNKNITIREYRDGDEASIMKLRGLVLSSPKDIDWWVWQHKLNPAGEAQIAVAELKGEGEIVAHECLMPLKMKIGANVGLVATSIDNMVHPDYRGRGIYKKVRNKMSELTQKSDIQFIYNFTNEIAARINLKMGAMGAKLLFKRIPVWIKPIRLESIIATYFKNKILTFVFTLSGNGILKLITRSSNYQVNSNIREVKAIDERFDALWEKVSTQHKIMLVRDRAYLNWRYVKKPDAEYTIYISEDDEQLLGYIILRNVKYNGIKIGWVCDMMTISKESSAAMDLITKAIQHFKTEITDIILFTLPQKTNQVLSLHKHGFIFASRWQRGLNPITISPIASAYPESFLLNPNNWYLTRGDSDLI